MVAQGQVSRTSNTKQGRDTKTSNESVSYIDGMLDRTSAQLTSSRQWAAAKASDTLDKTLTREQRDELSQRVQRFVDKNPRLAAFIATNVVLTGIPILLFLLFSVSTFVFSITTGLVLGTIGALVFTATTVGVALCIVFPIVLLTTIAAFLLFFWGLVGFTILKWAASTRRSVTQHSNEVAINGQTRNRIAESAEAAEEQRSKQDTMRFSNIDQFEQRSGEKRQPQDAARTTTSVTALPTDRQTTVTVTAGKNDDTASTIRVPDASTTGMVAS